MRIAFIAALVMLGSAAQAQTPAQAPNADAERLVDAPWEITNAARDKTCGISFKKERGQGGGFRLEFDDDCDAAFPITKDIKAWKFAEGDLLRLVDRAGKTLIEFSEVETGIFEAPTPNVGLLFLQPPGSNEPAQQAAAELSGIWALMAPDGRRMCRLSFDNTPAREGYALTVQSGCDAGVVRLGFNAWMMDAGELVLTPNRGNPWRFEPTEGGAWRRVPETDNPITLVKQP